MQDYKEQIEYYNQMLEKHNLGMGLNKEDLIILLQQVEKIPTGGNYVEIGVSDGSSIMIVAHFRPDVQCYGVEILDNSRLKLFIESINTGNINLILGKGSEEICKIWDKNIDLLFIDGEHLFPNVFWDYVGWRPFVRGPILFHDYENQYGEKFHVRQALQVFKNHPRYNFWSASEHGIGSSMAIINEK